MTTNNTFQMVGAPDPELKTSRILEESDEEYDVLSQEVDDVPYCFFNDVMYKDGDYVCSGSSILLHCVKGLWIRQGGCDPDNP